MRSITLDNSALDSVAANPAAVAACPSCFADRPKVAAGCSACQKGAQMAAFYARSKSSLAGMGPESRAAFKAALNVDEVQLVSAGRTIRF